MNRKSQEFNPPPVWLYNLITSIRNFLRQLYFNLVPAKVAVYEMSQQFWISRSIGVACELNLADIIGNKTLSIRELAEKAEVDTESLYRLMRALASEGVFKEVGDRMFRNTARSRALMDRPASMKYMIMHQLNYDNWALVNELTYSVKTARSAVPKLFGTSAFDYLKEDNEKNRLYNKAMNNTSKMIADSLDAVYDFSKTRTMVDVGGGTGMLVSALLQKHPDIKGVLLDKAHVVVDAGPVLERFGVKDRVEIIAADFFDTMPEGEIYLLKNILHIFNDEDSVRLLKKIAEAAKPGAKILVLEMLLKPGNKPSYGKIFDLQMLIGPMGARERTTDEYKALFEKAGISFKGRISMASPLSVFEGECQKK